jgi:hypothetical protein
MRFQCSDINLPEDRQFSSLGTSVGVTPPSIAILAHAPVLQLLPSFGYPVKEALQETV